MISPLLLSPYPLLCQGHACIATTMAPKPVVRIVRCRCPHGCGAERRNRRGCSCTGNARPTHQCLGLLRKMEEEKEKEKEEQKTAEKEEVEDGWEVVE